MIVSEAALTKAVTAAAEAAYDRDVAKRKEVFPPGVKFDPWNELDHAAKRLWLNEVLPLVWAAVSALPDPRHGAWEEGLHASFVYVDAVNPYPSDL